MKYLAKAYGDENLQKRIDGIMQSQNLSEQSAKAEIVANFCMTIFDENFITNFAKTHTKEARTIKDWFNRLVARIRQAMDKVKKYVTEYRAISDDIAEVERIRDLFNAALGERNANNTTNNTNVKYSNKNIDFERNIDEWDKEGRSNDDIFIIGNTGDVLQGLGAIDNQIYFYSKKINAILKKHRDSMTLDIIKKVPDIIDNPALVLSSHSRSKNNNTRLLLFGTVKASNGKPVMSVLDLKPFENGLLISDMQKLTSAYPLTRGQNGIRNYLNNCDVLYVTENKKTATKLVRQIGFFDPKKGLPIGFQQSGFIGSISYKNQNVNIQGKPFSDVFSEQAVKNKKVKFSVKQPVEETKDLVAIHNTTEEKLLKSLELGGLPSPSIAIMKAENTRGNNEFGNISLVFDKSSVDPQADTANKVYSSDAYTPITVRAEHKLNEDKAWDVYSKIRELSKQKLAYNLNPSSFYPDNLKSSIDSAGGINELIDSYKNDYAFKNLYLADTAEPIKNALTSGEWKKYNNAMATGIDAGIRISDTAMLIEGEKGDFNYKLVFYDNTYADYPITAVYGIGDSGYRQDVTNFDAKHISDVINALEEENYADKKVIKRVLRGLSESYKIVLRRYGDGNTKSFTVRPKNISNSQNNNEKSNGARVPKTDSQNLKFSVKQPVEETKDLVLHTECFTRSFYVNLFMLGCL